ncbi:hypothetical protein H3V53_37095 [Paraburkholderia bengalensis]|uniref:LysR family transcriptional regulator n=1 Tax=Paraburkholderia bengalensis TaxID=2747562 RepID=A0ABU8J4P8_9BURK
MLLESPAADVESVQLSLMTDNLVLCAAPFYLATRASPQEPNQLESHPCIAVASENQGSAAWRIVERDGS